MNGGYYGATEFELELFKEEDAALGRLDLAVGALDGVDVYKRQLMNVISGERYKVVPAEIKDYVRGQYGRPPVTISEKIRRQRYSLP